MIGLLGMLWAGFMAGGELQDWARARAARDWPSVEGVVEGWQVEQETDEGQVLYTPFVAYLYAVDGQAYRGFNRYLHDGGSGGFESYSQVESARAEHASFAKGAEVKVYYGPTDCALDLTRKRQVWF